MPSNGLFSDGSKPPYHSSEKSANLPALALDLRPPRHQLKRRRASSESRDMPRASTGRGSMDGLLEALWAAFSIERARFDRVVLK
ncbi:hypothetical protein NL676_008290 [Syzygium grande]|nr:hypothetical protein NL676_008290 [Syzygium grande]